MKNLLFLISANFPEINNDASFSTIGTVATIIALVLLSDKILAIFERIWGSLSTQIFESNPDSFSDFTSLDQTAIQVVTDIKIKFDDVAGNDEAKGELKEVVKFLKDPGSFTKLGASVPKGVLLGGPPGTGKTLFAKAIAGESGVPFLKVSGSQFVELLVGVGFYFH